MDWLTTTWTDVGMAILSLTAVYVAIIVYVRVAGLRSFAKMTAADFIMTLAVASVFAAVATSPQPSLPLGLSVLAALFLGQWIIAFLRSRSSIVEKVMDNSPLLLMDGPQILKANLVRASVSRSDLLAKLREANVTKFDQVLAVVFETTGDISVLHNQDGLDPALLEGVNRGVNSGGH